MFTPEEIAKIERFLNEGVAPEKIADEQFSLALSTFRAKLSNSGYRIAIRRELEQIVAVTPAIEKSERIPVPA